MEQTPNMNFSQMNTSPKKKKQTHVFFSILIGVAIAVLISLFYNYSFKLIYPNPTIDMGAYNDAQQKCYNTYNKQVYIKDQCLNEGGSWYQYASPNGTTLVDGKEVQIMGRCEYATKVQECLKQAGPNPYDNTARDLQTRYRSFGALILGIILVVISMFIRNVLAVSIGLSLGGISLLLTGTIYFWRDMPGLMRVIILALGLAAIIFFAVRKLKNDN